jgi:YidC/Oxa1 family membrane protein insertase
MNNQKFFLIIAISLSVFLLWDRWQTLHATDINGNLISQGQPSIEANKKTQQNLDIPSLPSTNATLDLPNETAQNTTALTTITTDVLTLEIAPKGGTIQNAWLNQYPIELNSEEKFQLLSSQAETFFQAQSGLLPKGKLPTHHDTFTTAQTHYQLEGDELIVPLTWENSGKIKVIKRYHLNKNSYLVGVDYQISNQSNQAINITNYIQLVRSHLDESSMVMPTFTGGALFNDEQVYEKIDFEDFNTQPKTTSKGGWSAMIQHYFFVAMIPDTNRTHTYSSKINNNNYLLTLLNPSQTLGAGASITTPINQFYIGPKEKNRIDSVAPGLDKTVDYGILFVIAKPISSLLSWIHSVIGSWGYSIILLTLLIKLAFYKLSEKSYRSMAGMRKLAPRMAKLKETYGDDRQKMGQKTMELYKKEKVNPASGCLPILVQIPVFISLYWVLLETVELRQTPFWYLTDLSSQDPYYILPVIMGISMFVQQRLNPPPPDPMQAKIMMALPVVFSIFFLWFPSGLVLYWVVNNILSITQQWIINKRING